MTEKVEFHIAEFPSVFSAKQNSFEFEKHGTNTVEEELKHKIAEEPVRAQPGVLNVFQSPNIKSVRVLREQTPHFFNVGGRVVLLTVRGPVTLRLDIVWGWRMCAIIVMDYFERNFKNKK